MWFIRARDAHNAGAGIRKLSYTCLIAQSALALQYIRRRRDATREHSHTLAASHDPVLHRVHTNLNAMTRLITRAHRAHITADETYEHYYIVALA